VVAPESVALLALELDPPLGAFPFPSLGGESEGGVPAGGCPLLWGVAEIAVLEAADVAVTVLAVPAQELSNIANTSMTTSIPNRAFIIPVSL